MENTFTKLASLKRAAKLAGAAFIVAFTLNANQANAQLKYGPESPVGENLPSNQITSSTAMDSTGNFVITWPYDGDIYARQYNASGVAQGATFQVNTYTTDSQDRPAIAMNASGGFIIAWQSADQDGDNWGIFAQRYDASGNPIDGEFQVNTYADDQQINPAVSMSYNGEFVITWMTYGEDGDGWGIAARSYEASGSPSPAFLVTSTTAGDQTGATVALNNHGKFAIVWESPDGDGNGIFLRTFYEQSVPNANDVQVNTTTDNNQNSPTIAVSDSTAIISWVSFDGDGNGVFAQLYTVNQKPIGSEFGVNSTTENDQWYPHAAGDNNGHFVITWHSNEQDGDTWGVFAQWYNNQGVGQGEFLVNTITDDFQAYPSIGMNYTGDFVIVYTTTQSEVNDFYFQRFGNTAPVISAQNFSIDENSTIGTEAYSVLASDVDAGQTLTYSITSGNTDNVFSIDPATGKISVAGPLSHATTPLYTLSVKITDNGIPALQDSAVVTVTINEVVVTGIAPNTIDGSPINLFPNPAQGQVQINATGEAAIKVTDLSGRLVKEENLLNNTLNIESLNSGIYLVEIIQNGQKTVKKLVVE